MIEEGRGKKRSVMGASLNIHPQILSFEMPETVRNYSLPSLFVKLCCTTVYACCSYHQSNHQCFDASDALKEVLSPTCRYRFMVIDRLGTDLQKKFEECGRKFPRKLVLQLGLRLVGYFMIKYITNIACDCVTKWLLLLVIK